MIGQRIKQARAAAGLSLRALSAQAGVSHTAIAKYEQGDATPSSEVLLTLSKALGVRVEYFFRAGGIELQGVEYRKQARVPQKALRRIEAATLEQLERFLELQELIPQRLVRPFSVPANLPTRIATLDAIEDLALALRSAWGLGRNPIPVLCDSLEERGILVFQVETPAGGQFDGLAAKVQDMPVVVVGRDWPGDRQRFTLAHELGHLVLDGRLAPELDEEKAAHRFAGAFLAPKPEVIKELGATRTRLEPRELCVLKAAYGLSMAAWLFRARDLGVLSEHAYIQHQKLFRSRAWHKREPCDPYPREAPQLFSQLLFHALAEDLVTESKAAELMGMSTMDFHAMRHMERADAAAHQ
ncbi:transcriptional regulator [Thiohalocapsa halophila]|uniref:Transcriptional regulator n=1 Tax=Thiohalocapsa halophila TaxID=69359 RepID=A0ABS1CJ44_9GAMM|nr:XRE family transcriptional regulator [Thiohalocapsa halophila]MBK1631927.1 transcriptional regulator [Thiohalocapsa halophila]